METIDVSDEEIRWHNHGFLNWPVKTIHLRTNTDVSWKIDHRKFVMFDPVCQNQGAVSIRKTVLLGMAIPMLKIRRPTGRLIFNMGIPIPGKTVFLIETGPWNQDTLSLAYTISKINLACLRWTKYFDSVNQKYALWFTTRPSISYCVSDGQILTHWGLLMHTYSSTECVIFGSSNGLSPTQWQAIAITISDSVSKTLRNKIQTFSSTKMYGNLLSDIYEPFLFRSLWFDIRYMYSLGIYIHCHTPRLSWTLIVIIYRIYASCVMYWKDESGGVDRCLLVTYRVQAIITVFLTHWPLGDLEEILLK